MSHGLGVWDVRGTGRRLGWLAGRRAWTMQRIHADRRGSEVWSGGTDGKVRVWRDLGMREGVLEPDEELQAHEGERYCPILSSGCADASADCVSAVALHPSGTVLATCSGQRHDPLPEGSRSPLGMETPASTDCRENSLKVWELQ